MRSDKKSISNVQRTGIFITLIAAAFITSMSTTVTANMIPNFTEYFGVSSNLAQWLTSGATLISGITIPITAFLIKRVPNKVYFLSAMTAFTVGSQWIGFDADMARIVADKLGVEAQFVVIDWDNKIMELDSNNIDVVWNGMTLTNEVTEAMECTNAYCNNAQVILVPGK